MTIIKILYIILGTISLGIGVIAIFIPGLPTTPFLLLTAGLYMRSSPRLYRLIITNKYIGPIIQDFQKKRGMTRITKLRAIGTMWLMIGISVIFLIDSLTIDLIVIAVGVIGTVVMGFIVKTVDNSDKKSNKSSSEE